jgi:glycosyltransferase involved in cell wall biosynthesis
MRVVVAHNLYRSHTPSGENNVVIEDIQQLLKAGVDVIPFMRSSDAIPSMPLTQKLAAAAGPVYNPRAVRDFKRVLSQERVDVVHVHNLFPLLSPWIVREAKKAGIPVVQTVHNYRHTCVKGIHYRHEHVCNDCLDRRIPLPAVRHACYRDSRAQSAAMALGQVAHNRTWLMVDHFLALSSFMADRLAAQGILRERITVRPTAVPDPNLPNQEPDRALLFVGRLDQAKGINMLLDAWTSSCARKDGWKLRIAGTGPLAGRVARVAECDSSVIPLGGLTSDEMSQAYRDSAAVLVPSIWYEGYPRVIAEAFAHRRPVIASRIGSLATVCNLPYALTVEPKTDAWGTMLDRLTKLDLAMMGDAARDHWERTLNSNASLETLLNVYRNTTQRRRPAPDASSRG